MSTYAAAATAAATVVRDSKGPELQRVMAAMITVPFAFMALRFYCKMGSNKKFGWDDAVLLLSWMLHAAYCGVVITGTAFGLGNHIDTVSQKNLVVSLKLLYIGNWFVIWAISLSKTSFAMTLMALVVKKSHIWLLWACIISLNVIMGLDAIFQFTQCTPVERTWDLQVEGTCWDTRIVIDYTIFAGAYSAFLDFVLAGVPWLLFWDIKMLAAEKIGLIVAMSLGVFSGITACVKTAYLPSLSRSTDLTYSTADLLMWAAAETAIIIIGASIPYLRKLLWRFFRHPKPGNSLTKSGSQHPTIRGPATRLGSGNVQASAYATHVPIKGDDASEKSSLGDSDGIMVSQQFTVRVDSDDAAGPRRW